MKKILLILILICNPLFAQQNAIDSLNRAVLSAKSDTSKARLLHDLAHKLSKAHKYDSAIIVSREALKLAEKEKWDLGIVKSQMAIAKYNYLNENFTEAIQYFYSALSLLEKVEITISGKDKEKAKTYKADIYQYLGVLYYYKDNFAKSLDYQLKALQLNEELKYDLGIVDNLNLIGNVYSEMGSRKNISTTTQKKDSLFGLALNYYEKALKILLKTDDKEFRATIIGNIAVVYLEQADMTNALAYYNKALKINEEINNKSGIALNYGNIGWLYADMKKYKEGEYYLKKAIQMTNALGEKYNEMLYREKISFMYSDMGKYQEAFNYYRNYINIRDSINNDENSKKQLRFEMKFEFDKKLVADSVANAKAQEIKNIEIAKHKAEIKVKRNQQYALYGGVFFLLVFSLFIYNRLQVTNKQKKIIEEQKVEVEIQRENTELQKQLVEEKNHEITQSIQYAQRIQSALLPSEEFFGTAFTSSFVLFRPKDIVSGDYYWISNKDKYVFYATADCTGHGVPGGFMSMLGTALLNEIVDERKVEDCGEVLTLMREKIMQALKQAGDSESKDGMDMVLIRIDKNTLEMQYAAANNSFYVIRHCEDDRTKQSVHTDELHHSVRNDVLHEMPCDKMPVGVYHSEVKPFRTYTHQLQKGDTIYTYTDGYADQFGGDLSTGSRVKKYTYKRLREKLVAISQEPLAKQKTILENEFKNWKGDNDQIDDVCLIGVKI